jgi:hypothetical protein
MSQICSYNWTSEDFFAETNARLASLFVDGETIEFERIVRGKMGSIEIEGQVDMMTDRKIFEVKCVE